MVSVPEFIFGFIEGFSFDLEFLVSNQVHDFCFGDEDIN